MELIKTIVLIIGILVALKIVLNNVLSTKKKNLVRSPDLVETQPREAFNLKQRVSVDDIVNQPQAQAHELDLDLDQVSQNLPTAKAAGSGSGNCLPVAPNHDSISFDHMAEFSNEVTDTAKAFSINPSLFFNDQRHNAYVPDAVKWGEQADMMHQANINNRNLGNIKEYNYETRIN